VRVAICGGGGFIGSAVVDLLLEDGHDLRVFERPLVEPHRQFLASEKIPRDLGRRGHPQGLRAHQRCHRGVCAAPSTIVADARSSTSLPGFRVSLNGLLNLTERVLGRESHASTTLAGLLTCR
jgi:UDP-glucose 4-epimerase